MSKNKKGFFRKLFSKDINKTIKKKLDKIKKLEEEIKKMSKFKFENGKMVNADEVQEQKKPEPEVRNNPFGNVPPVPQPVPQPEQPPQPTPIQTEVPNTMKQPMMDITLWFKHSGEPMTIKVSEAEAFKTIEGLNKAKENNLMYQLGMRFIDAGDIFMYDVNVTSEE